MIKGAIDEQGRCRHYYSAKDIIAIKMKCCDQFYSCISCHEELAGHDAVVWLKSEYGEKAVVCGNCKTILSIADYVHSNNQCPACMAAFNPKCANHYHYYFEV